MASHYLQFGFGAGANEGEIIYVDLCVVSPDGHVSKCGYLKMSRSGMLMMCHTNGILRFRFDNILE